MTATNHVLTGSVWAAATVTHLSLWLVLPVAFLLHFVLDSLPHYGDVNDSLESMKRLKWILPLDMSVAAAILVTIIIVKPAHWPVLVIGGVLCASPDLWSFTRFTRFLKTGKVVYSQDWFARFHRRIQWGERAWGAWIELAWFLGFGYMLITRL